MTGRTSPEKLPNIPPATPPPPTEVAPPRPKASDVPPPNEVPAEAKTYVDAAKDYVTEAGQNALGILEREKNFYQNPDVPTQGKIARGAVTILGVLGILWLAKKIVQGSEKSGWFGKTLRFLGLAAASTWLLHQVAPEARAAAKESSAERSTATPADPRMPKPAEPGMKSHNTTATHPSEKLQPSSDSSLNILGKPYAIEALTNGTVRINGRPWRLVGEGTASLATFSIRSARVVNGKAILLDVFIDKPWPAKDELIQGEELSEEKLQHLTTAVEQGTPYPFTVTKKGASHRLKLMPQ